MKVSIFLSILAVATAVPTPRAGSVEARDTAGCVETTAEDGTITKRCAIPWTKNYGEYDEEDHEKRDDAGCVVTTAEDGTITKRCAIPWTKNYGEYDE
jgi:hypothetical protein